MKIILILGGLNVFKTKNMASTTQTRAKTARDLTTVQILFYLERYDLTGSETSLCGGILGQSVPSGEHI